MTLTIPKAGVIGGAAAAPRFEADRTGEIVAGFGQKMADVGFFIQREREERGLGQARVAAMRGLNDLQTRYQQIGDPDEIDRGYAQDAAALRGQIVETLPQGIRDQAGLMFDEMNVSHATQAGRRAVQLRQSQEVANIGALGEELARTAGVADPDTFAAAQAQMDQQLQSAVSRGIMTPEEAQRTREQFGNQAGQARAARLLSDDPDALVAAIDAGEFVSMSGEQAEGWRARGTAASKAAAAKAQAEADRLAKERRTAAADVLKDGTAVFRTGRDFARADEVDALLADPAVAELPEAREYRSARRLHEALPDFAVLPLPQKRELLAKARQGGIVKDYDNDTVEAMEAAIEADEKAFAEDPLARAAQIGLTAAPDLPDPSTAASEDLVGGLRARRHYGTSLREQGYTDKPAFFTAAEREQWKPLVGSEASPADKARIARDLAAGLGPEVELAATELGADPVFAYVGGGLAHGLSPELGRHIFEGQRVIEGKQVQLPAANRRNQAFFAEFSDLFADGTEEGWTDQAGVRNQIIGAADALYAYRKRGELVGGDAEDASLDPSAYLQAAHEVMGGTGKYDARSARGGVQEINGRLTILPPEVGASEVEDRLEVLAEAMADPEQATAAWRSLALSSNAPDLGGEPMDPRTLRSLTLRATGPDSYVLVRERGDGRLSIVQGEDGAPVEISMQALMKFAVQQ